MNKSRFSFGVKAHLTIALLGVLSLAYAATFNLYSPAAGIQKNTGSTYVNTAATSSDVRALWTGTCNASSFLRGDGACAAVGGGSVTSVGLTMPSGFSVGGSPVTSSGTLAVTTTLSGVLKGNGSGFTTAAAADIYGLWSGTCNSSTFLRGDGSCQSPGGGGTVTSVGLTAPTGFSVTGSPVTGSGSLGLTTTLSGVVHGNGSGFTAANVALGSEVSGTLPAGNGGTGVTSLGNLTKADDTNVTLTLGGTPTGALITSASITAGWTGTLSVPRGGLGVGTVSGVLKGNGTSAVGSAASSDVTALWSGTCNSSSFLRGDGACAAAGGGSVDTRYAVVSFNGASCSISGAYGSNFTFSACTHTGTGVYHMTFSSAFSAIPSCTATLLSDNDPVIVMISPSTSSAIDVIVKNSSFTTTDDPGNINLHCMG